MSADFFVHSEYKLDLNSTKLTIEGISKKFLVPYSIVRLCRETKDAEQELDRALKRIEDLESNMSKLTFISKILLEILKENKAQVLTDSHFLTSIPSQDFLDSVKMELNRGQGSKEEEENEFKAKNNDFIGKIQEKKKSIGTESYESFEEVTQLMNFEGQDDNFSSYRNENGKLRIKIKKLESKNYLGKVQELQIEVDDWLVRYSDLSKQLRRISGEFYVVEFDKEKNSHKVTIKEMENYKNELEAFKKTSSSGGNMASYNLRCQATTLQGNQCKRNCQNGRKYCWQH